MRFFKRKKRQFEIVKGQMRKHGGIEIKLPQRGTKNAIAYDIFSPIDFIVKPGEKFMLWTDVKAKFNDDEALIINVRSSMGKHGIMLANSQGWIESDYYGNETNDGNLGLMFVNAFGDEPWIVKAGDKIGQCMFIKYLTAENGNSNKIRTGGFGSTGK